MADDGDAAMPDAGVGPLPVGGLGALPGPVVGYGHLPPLPPGLPPAAAADAMQLVNAISSNQAAADVLKQLLGIVTPAAAAAGPSHPRSSSSRAAHQPAEFTGKGSSNWEQYRKVLVPYLVAANEQQARWGQIAVTFLAQGSPAFEHFHRTIEQQSLDYTDASQLTWTAFDGIMGSGTFGVPPTDRSVRKKLQAFKQRLPLDTPSFLNLFLENCAKAPTQIDSQTKIHLFLEAAHPLIADKYELPPDGGMWKDWEHLYSIVSVNASLYDRQVTALLKQQQLNDKLSNFKPFTTAVSYAAAAGKDAGYLGAERHGRWPKDQGQSARPGHPYARPPQAGQGRSAEQKYGHKQSYVPGLTKEQLAYNAQNNICHKCNRKAETPAGKFDVTHRRECTGQRRNHVSG